MCWGKGSGGGGGIIFFYLSSYFALISLHTNFHDPRTIPSGRKVCVGGWVVGGGVEGNFSVSFGPKPGLGSLDLNLDLDQAEQFQLPHLTFGW